MGDFETPEEYQEYRQRFGRKPEPVQEVCGACGKIIRRRPRRGRLKLDPDALCADCESRMNQNIRD